MDPVGTVEKMKLGWADWAAPMKNQPGRDTSRARVKMGKTDRAGRASGQVSAQSEIWEEINLFFYKIFFLFKTPLI
jgi:hypothetical protein